MYLRFRQNLHDNGSISGFIALNKKIVGKKKKSQKIFILFSPEIVVSIWKRMRLNDFLFTQCFVRHSLCYFLKVAL